MDRLSTYRPFEIAAMEKREACKVPALAAAATMEAAVAAAPIHAPEHTPERRDDDQPAPFGEGTPEADALAHQPSPPRPGPPRAGRRASDAHPQERMQLDRIHMVEQDALARSANFEEVNLGLTEGLA